MSLIKHKEKQLVIEFEFVLADMGASSIKFVDAYFMLRFCKKEITNSLSFQLTASIFEKWLHQKSLTFYLQAEQNNM